MKNAIILCSGGLDSVVTAHYIKKKLGYNKLIFLFFDYGQRTVKQERFFAKKNANKLKAEFIEIKLSWLNKISTSLINVKSKNQKIKKIKRRELKDTKKESEKWYVPCRNTLFLVYALALAESLHIKEKKIYDIFVGFKCEGKESYPDTTPEFIKQINKLTEISAKCKSKIKAPLINKDKDEIIKLGKMLGVDFRDTYSCYTGTKNKKQHCGSCLSCRLRQEAFYWANIKDPTTYRKKMKDFRIA